MTRTSVVVRTAGPSDAPALLGLAEHARASGDAVGRVASPADAARLEAALSRPDVQVLVAEQPVPLVVADDDASPVPAPVGVLVLRRGELLPLSGSEAAHVEQLWVHPEHRRRGVAHELLRSATTHAAQAGLGELTCTVPPADRDAQRFLARLGFAPLVSRRVVGVAALRRRLGGQTASSRRQGLEQLLARRRREGRVTVGGPSPT